ncbi:MAG TPA: hypothetical protein VHD83_13460 [Puia sp.]|nr:hypothetical protein [Puia sp.]
MKRLSILLLPALLALTPHSTSPRQTPPPAVAAQTLYYWFSVPDDMYHDRATVNDEIDEMWLYYGTLVNTTPAGGVLIERGYFNNALPHTQFPAAYLYAHYQ